MKTPAFKSGKRLALFAAALFFASRVHADGHSTIIGQITGIASFGESGLEILAVFPVPATVDVYSDRGIVAAEAVADLNGNFAIEDLKPGTYTVVASFPGTFTLFFGSTGSFETATQAVSIHNKTDANVDLALIFIPSSS